MYPKSQQSIFYILKKENPSTNLATNEYSKKTNPSTSLLEEPKPCIQDIGPEESYSANNGSPKSSANGASRKANLKRERIPPHVRRQILSQARRIKLLQQKLRDANNFGKQKVINYLSKHFNADQMIFLELQLRNIGKKNHGQRYTNEQKTMMLAIYKRGPRVYRYVSLLFGLPSIRTLRRHSAILKFETGINTKLFDLMKSTASTLGPLDKICTLGWDEMALTHQLSYCSSEDYIDGFVDFGEVRLPEFATHSLTFMIRGINRPFKQPIAYFYTQNLTGIKLAELITLVVRAVHDTGFKIIGSVCDQTVTMAAGVNRLINPEVESMKQTGKTLCYYIDGNRIIHCFDPPHVLKTLRNNLLTKNLRHSVTSYYEPDCEAPDDDTEKQFFAKWNDIKNFYEFDKKNSCKLVSKITKDHVYPENDKMKVSLAAQVFSKALGSIMLFLSNHKLVLSSDDTPIDFTGTAYFLLFVNNLFDSVNGGGKTEAGTFRGSITNDNKHKYYRFWNYAIAHLEKMDFINDSDGVNNRSTVIQETISTVKGYMELTETCLSMGIASVSLRQMNQDGLENFFGSVRAVCHNSKSPIASLFRPGYTNLLLTNLTSQHSISGNCENDENRSLLKNVCELYDDPALIMSKSGQECTDGYISPIDLEVANDEIAPTQYIENDALVVESGKACQSIITSTTCELCKYTLEAYCPLNEHRIITAIDLEIPRLTYPTVLFMEQFKLLFKTVETLVPYVCHERNLYQTLTSSLNCRFKRTWLYIA